MEIVPDRYTFEGQTAVAGWGVVPAKCCVAQATATSSGMLLLMADGQLLLADGSASPRKFSPVPVSGGTLGVNASLLIGSDGMPIGAANAAGVRALSCKPGSSSDTAELSCALSAAFCHGPSDGLGAVHDTAVVPAVTQPAIAFIASDYGLWRAMLPQPPTGQPCSVQLVINASSPMARGTSSHDEVAIPPAPMLTTAATPQLVAAGNSAKVWLINHTGLNASTPWPEPLPASILSWSWVTAPLVGAGGVYDDAPRSMEFDQVGGGVGEKGDLYVGNDIALNVRAADGSVDRIDGDGGLPYANISAILTTVSSPIGGTGQLWLGTDLGLAIRSSDPDADPVWRYLFGPRWHPGKSVTALAAASGTTVFAATDGGVVWLEQQVRMETLSPESIDQSYHHDART